MFSKAIILALLPATMALLAGAVLPFQAIINGMMGKALGHPLWGAVVSLAVSMLVLLPLLWIFNVPAPRIGSAVQGPWWLWIGGVFGAAFVVCATAWAPKLGAGNFLVLVVTSQMIAALVVDHFGLMGLPSRPATAGRIAGVVFILLGAVLIQMPGKTVSSAPAAASNPHNR